MTAHQAGHGPPGRPSATNAGSAANPTAYGTQDQTVALSRRSYAQAAATPVRWTAPARSPQANDSGTQSASAAYAATHTSATRTVPSTTGLPRRPAARSRCASNASLHQPTDNCPVSTARAVSTQRAALWPAVTASAVVSAVTATTGPGWQDPISPAVRPAHPASG